MHDADGWKNNWSALVMAIRHLHHEIDGFEKERTKRTPRALDGTLMAVMHVGAHAVVVEHTSVMPSCGPSPAATSCVLTKHQIPCAMRGRAVWRTVGCHDGVPVGSFVDVQGEHAYVRHPSTWGARATRTDA